MKSKVIIFLVSLLFVKVNGIAQEINFPLNAKGNIEYAESFDCKINKQELFEKAKSWVISMSSGNYKDVVIDEEKETGIITVRAGLDGHTTYNPFSGTTQETILFTLRIKCEYNKYSYTISDITLSKIYAGYGVNRSSTAMTESYKNYLKAKEDLVSVPNDPNKSKKEKKDIIEDLEDDIEDYENSLGRAYNELNTMITSFKAKMQE
jgi:hypothetical protein